jgi:hypothetical protein
VKTRVDARFRDEARRFAFRFACDECAHFDTPGVRCSLGYPAAPRRAELDVAARAAPGGAAESALELCKSFELA